jgi:peptidoglycan-N-acetylglucosamine deacetylase
VAELTSRIRGRLIDAVNSTGTWALSPPRTCFGAVQNHGPRDVARVALTFDDGPGSPSTEFTLDALATLAIPATFFCVGDMVRRRPDLVRRAVDEGHVIGSHTSSHSRRTALSLGDESHLDDADEAIFEAVGQLPALYRPPWGWLTPLERRRAHRRGMVIVGWDVYPDDWHNPPPAPETLAEQVCSQVRPGSIILMHDAAANRFDCDKWETAAALPIIHARLSAAGYSFVSIPELLGVPASRVPGRPAQQVETTGA